MKNAYNVAFGDWFNPLVIHRVDLRRGETVRIQVRPDDDVTVTGMQVLILDEQGKVVEKGEAIKSKGHWWEYVPTAEGKVVVEARDLAGNKIRDDI